MAKVTQSDKHTDTENQRLSDSEQAVIKLATSDVAVDAAATVPPTQVRQVRQKKDRPGRLSGRIPFAIHTADAQLLFSGYVSKAAVGLLQFGGQMTKVWDAAEKDDPYADWYLLKVYDGIVQLRNQLAQAIDDYQANIRTVYGDTPLTPFVSQQPVVKQLWFRTQYGYLGANVVAKFDELMRIVLTAHRVGVLLEQSQEDIRAKWNKKIMSLFQLPFKWQPFGLTRQDVEAKNALANKAQETLGKLPRQVLDKSLRAPFAPYINHTIDSTQAGTVQSEAVDADK